MATIAHQHYSVTAQQAHGLMQDSIDSLFGSTKQCSRIWKTDAIAMKTKQNPMTMQHQQIFTAIDRFTRGVKDGALYKVNAADCDVLEATCELPDIRKLEQNPWWIGLLLLLTRDLMEEGTYLGWGRAKGYGSLKLSVNYDGGDGHDGLDTSNFNEVLDWFQKNISDRTKPIHDKTSTKSGHQIADEYLETLHAHIAAIAEKQAMQDETKRTATETSNSKVEV